jgi:hypothetical protein
MQQGLKCQERKVNDRLSIPRLLGCDRLGGGDSHCADTILYTNAGYTQSKHKLSRKEDNRSKPSSHVLCTASLHDCAAPWATRQGCVLNLGHSIQIVLLIKC